MDTSFTFYTLQNLNEIYTGYTSSLIQRFASHNIFGKDSTAKYRPWILKHDTELSFLFFLEIGGDIRHNISIKGR